LGQPHPRWSKIADFESIFARSASAVTPSEKNSINTNRKFITQIQGGCFTYEIAFRLKKRQLQSFFVWKMSAINCKAFIGLTIRAKMTGG